VRERIVRGAGLAGVGFALSRAITFGGYIAIAALISPREVGQFAAGSLVAGIGTLFAESGMLAAVIQWREDVDEAASTAFAATLLNGVLLTAIAVVTAPLVGDFFDSDRVGDIALACSGFLFFRSLQVVPDALLQRRFSFLRRVAIDPLGAATFVAVSVVLCANGMGPWGLVIGTYALYVVQVTAAWGFVRWRPRRAQMSFAVWRRLAGFGRHVVASEIVRQSVSQLDQLLLGRFSGTAVLGQYNYGMRLAAQPVSGFVSIAAYVLFPAFARVAEDEPERMRATFGESLVLASLVMLPLSFVLIPLGDQLALLAFGPEWGGAGNTIKALCLVGVGWTWASLTSEAAKSVGRPQLITRMHLVALAVSVVAMPSLLWADETGIGAAVSAAALASGTYGLWKVAAPLGTSLGALLRPVAGLAAAAGVAAGVAGLLDVTVFTDAANRGDAGLCVLGEGGAALAAFIVALRVFAPEGLARLNAAAGHLRRTEAAPA
jgi:O-antigen/teichoic acid export membrane protein